MLRSICYMAFGIGMLVGVMPHLIRMSGASAGDFSALGIAWLGPGVLGLGAVMYFSCGLDFVRLGRGTPVFWDPPRGLVENVWFRNLRNPMYAGVGLMIVGQALWSGSVALLAYAAVVMAGFHCIVVMYEEPHLRSVFGNDYEAYCLVVPRWLPRIARRESSRRLGNPRTD